LEVWKIRVITSSKIAQLDPASNAGSVISKLTNTIQSVKNFQRGQRTSSRPKRWRKRGNMRTHDEMPEKRASATW